MTLQATVKPLSLQDVPALIESVFPAQKVSFEAQRERNAGAGQTLTSLGSYWKGRKPLILVRAILLGILLPPTNDSEKDLAIFEQLLGFDMAGLARRALVNNTPNAQTIAKKIILKNPWDYFCVGRQHLSDSNWSALTFPLPSKASHLKISWKKGISEKDKLSIYEKYLQQLTSYEERSLCGKRPEEIDPHWLYEPVWVAVNNHYAHLGIHATSFDELIEQLGLLRYGHRPRVGDVFSGGGSIPFEAARLGCDVYGSDLNPVASMLTWGALNLILDTADHRQAIETEQHRIADDFEATIKSYGIETDDEGNHAKYYLYCLETICPETGWKIPLATSWVIAKKRDKEHVIAQLKPNDRKKCFDIEVICNASDEAMQEATQGTVQDGHMVYALNGKKHRLSIKSLRGDYKDKHGQVHNRLRRWSKEDCVPHDDDIFTERLYAIQWATQSTLNKTHPETFFARVTEQDLEREQQVINQIKNNLVRWQQDGLVPDMAIEPGQKTNELIRTRGWTYWHHLFHPRHLLLNAVLRQTIREKSNHPAYFNVLFCRMLNLQSRLTIWNIFCSKSEHVFYNMALNTLFNYGNRSSLYITDTLRHFSIAGPWEGHGKHHASNHSAETMKEPQDIYITDPPYADAVHYHEITEYFIAWMRQQPPVPFDQWLWDSRRTLAIKGIGTDFYQRMIEVYRTLAKQMPNHGIQCVMFTNQDSDVWAGMVNIFWAVGLQVVSVWCIATETNSGLRKGGYVQGTIILLLKKRATGMRQGFKQYILPSVELEVKKQIDNMMRLNAERQNHVSEPVFCDADLQMAGYAAALKVLTGYTEIGGEDVTTLGLQPRSKGAPPTIADEIIEEATSIANNYLTPDGLERAVWAQLSGIERFVLRMMDFEKSDIHKLDNYQNYAKAFHVKNYAAIMNSVQPNRASLKKISQFSSRDLSDQTELGASRLAPVIIAIQQLLQDTEPEMVMDNLRNHCTDFLSQRALLGELSDFIAKKSSEDAVRHQAEILTMRLKNMRFGA